MVHRLSKGLGIWLALLVSIAQVYSQIDVEHVVAIGRNALHFNDYVVSIGYFNQAIDARPWIAMPYYYRAVAKINLEDFNGAAADASLCLERNQFISKAYLVRGIARQNLGQGQDAIADYTKGLELAPNDLGMRLNLALAYSQNKDFDRAEEALTTLLRYTPGNAEAYNLRAGIALERGDTTLAIQRIDEALALDSTQATPYKLKAHIYASREQFDLSLKALDRAIELEPKEASLLTNRGIVHYRTNKLREAMQDYSQALTLDPKHRVARYNRALLRTLVGELPAALSDWHEVLRLEPNNHIARYNRAIISQRLGRWQDAVEDLNVVLREYPSFVDGFLLRAQLRKTLRDNKGAEQDYWHAWDLQQNRQYRASAHTQSVKNQSRATRSAQDAEINKYAMLIEERPDVSSHKPQYSNTARGRVQDRDTQVAPCAPYYLTYFSQLGSDRQQLSQIQYTPKLLEDEHKRSSLEHTLKLYSQPYALSSQDIKVLEDLIQRELPQTAEQAKHVYLHRGIAYALMQDYDRSIEYLDQAIGLDPEYSLAYLARSLALMRKSTLEQQQDKTKAGMPLSAKTDLPSPIPSITPKTKAVIPTNYLLEAKEDLNIVIKLAPTFAYAYYNRGLLLEQSGDVSAALTDYSTALKLSPRMAEAYFNRGLLLLSQGKKKEGLADLSQAGELGLYQAYNIMKRISKD